MDNVTTVTHHATHVMVEVAINAHHVIIILYYNMVVVFINIKINLIHLMDLMVAIRINLIAKVKTICHAKIV